jgi:hypothetical protein
MSSATAVTAESISAPEPLRVANAPCLHHGSLRCRHKSLNLFGSRRLPLRMYLALDGGCRVEVGVALRHAPPIEATNLPNGLID